MKSVAVLGHMTKMQDSEWFVMVCRLHFYDAFLDQVAFGTLFFYFLPNNCQLFIIGNTHTFKRQVKNLQCTLYIFVLKAYLIFEIVMQVSNTEPTRPRNLATSSQWLLCDYVVIWAQSIQTFT